MSNWRRAAWAEGASVGGVEQPVGGGMQQQAEGVGPEAVVAEAVGRKRVLEVFDPVLGIAAIDVVVVEGEGRVVPGGHDEAGVRAFSEDLGLEDDAAGMGPGGGLIAGLAGQADLGAALLALRARASARSGAASRSSVGLGISPLPHQRRQRMPHHLLPPLGNHAARASPSPNAWSASLTQGSPPSLVSRPGVKRCRQRLPDLRPESAPISW